MKRKGRDLKPFMRLIEFGNTWDVVEIWTLMVGWGTILSVCSGPTISKRNRTTMTGLDQSG